MRVRHLVMLGSIALALIGAVATLGLTAFAGSATPTPGATVSPDAEPTPSATASLDVEPTEAATGELPPGLSGELTFRRQDELITLRLPDAIETARTPALESTPRSVSPDGRWLAQFVCADDHTCMLELVGPDTTRSLQPGGYIQGLEWSSRGALAYSVGYWEGDALVSRELLVIDDPAAAVPRLVQATDGPLWHPYAWLPAGDLLLALNDGAGASFLRFGADGTVVEVARASAGVSYLYPSPNGTFFAFTQNDLDGWRLAGLVPASGEVLDFGNMGSDGPDGGPVVVSPEQKSPMAIAWSPDDTKLAFGGGFEPPYTLTMIDVASGAVTTATFDEGYAGEIEWAADGDWLAVSTYDVDRTRHEVYVVDPATGDARYLLSGCLILWSPDGRFIALHAEKEPGIAVVDADSGAHGMLTDDGRDVPVAWDEG